MSLPDVYVPFDSHSYSNKGQESVHRPQAYWNHQLQSFGILAAPYFRESVASRWMLACIVVLALLASALRVVFSYLMRDFWSALADSQVQEFYNVLYKFLIALLVLVPITVFYQFQRQRLAIYWREWMTERTLELYYANRVYYTLERDQQTTLDNVDQRIQDDVRSFTVFSLNFFLVLLNSATDLVAFSIILFSIQPHLFLAIVLFASFGSVATWLIGKRLVLLNFEKLKREANFRFSLVRVRENAESIAFLKGEDIERSSVDARFQTVLENMHSINAAERNLNFFTTLYNYTVWILPILVVAPDYFAGDVSLGVVQQAANAFSHVLDDVSLIVNEFESLSQFAAGIDRLYQFYVAMRKADRDRDETSPLLLRHGKTEEQGIVPNERTIDLRQIGPVRKDTALATPSPVALSVQDLSLFTPDDSRALFRRLSFTLPWNKNVLIVGDSGIGKSSLLRAIAGLWTCGTGTIDRPSDDETFFCPQRPYCALGSLRHQLLYPQVGSDETAFNDEICRSVQIPMDGTTNQRVSDHELLEILKAVDLYDIATRSGKGDALIGLNAVLDWSSTLSLGEQQRLAFGRILVNSPKCALLDESTSALDTRSEKQMYTLLRDRAITYISVGHRKTLEAYHDYKLTLRGGDKYSFEQIPLE